MGKEQRLQLIHDIRELEHNLSAKIQQLATAEELDDVEGDGPSPGTDTHALALRECIKRIGRLSRGGNSVEDVRAEREP